MTGATSLLLNGTNTLPATSDPASAVVAAGDTALFVVHATNSHGAESPLSGNLTELDQACPRLQPTPRSVTVLVAKADAGKDCTAVTGCCYPACG
ncbi:MAG: hypothetical protein IPH03_10350 [Tetrasphaera sp.]|nr:hypothetical protein [Tetrasphaera sp.]